MSNTPQVDYETAIVGSGPAAIGPFVAAARDGRIEQLLHKGVVVFGAQDSISSGSLGKYQINSNSPGGDFLEPFDDAKDDTFATELTSAEATELRNHAGDILPLPIIGKFIDVIGARIQEKLSRKGRFAPNTSVNEITWNSTHHHSHVEDITAGNVVLATGGKPKFHEHLSADNVLQADLDALGIQNNTSIEIIGSSHSAFSAADRLLKHADTKGVHIRIVIRHKSPIRLFYDLQKESAPDWYNYDAQNDVCPATKRVHRFGGLRGDARALYLRIQSQEEKRVSLIGIDDQCVQSPHHLIIDARGYEPNGINILEESEDTHTKPLELQRGSDNQFEVGPLSQILSQQGVVRGLFGIGLGYGIRPNGSGEPSFSGRLDGVNVYWGPVGERIVTSILDKS